MASIGTIIASARSALGRWFGVRPREEGHSETRLQASYDAARSGQLDNHWQYADRLDADSAHSPEVRHTLISRSRYEAESNGFYAGMHQTHATAVTGTGPRLRMQTKNAAFNQAVERDWEEWAKQVQLRRKLWCMELAEKKDGEVFGILQNNPALTGRIKLDFQPIEAEQCQTPYLPQGIVGRIDGIHADQFGNVIGYDILPIHPGNSLHFAMTTPDFVSARNVQIGRAHV